MFYHEVVNGNPGVSTREDVSYLGIAIQKGYKFYDDIWSKIACDMLRY